MHTIYLFLLLAAGCGGEAEDKAVVEDDKCPTVDKLQGRWVRVAGSAGDTNNRFEVKDAEGGGYTGIFILGDFDRMRTQGAVRKSDVVFTERLEGVGLREYKSGKRMKRRIHVEPRQSSCSLRITHVGIWNKGGNEVEQSMPGRDEYLRFPDGQPFGFEPCDGPLFLRKAALQSKAANWEMSRNGGPQRSHQLGKKIPVGVWTDAAQDGGAGCTFDMDLWFDDRPMEGKTAIPAGAVEKGKRRWFVAEWSAPYSGNHHFQAYRYKTCGGERKLIGINCLDAVLHR